MGSQRKEFFCSLLWIGVILFGAVVHYFFFLEKCKKAPAELLTPQEYNAYLARYHRFDSVILGSSISMCFRCTEFDRVCGGYSYKLTVPGCEVPVWTAMARFVCRHQNIRAVLADIHEELLFLPAANMDFIDDYYTEKNTASAIRAGVTLKTLRTRQLFYWNKLHGTPDSPFSRDDLYDWSKEHPCGKFYYARSIVRHPITPDRRRKLACIRENLEPLAAFIRESPQIRFYLYLPPYSVLAYDDGEQFLCARKTAMDLLLPLPNVELYDFQAADLVTDFDNYKDLTHFSPEISSWILRQMQEKKYRVTPENRAGFEQRFADVVLAFDRQKAVKELEAFYFEHASENEKRKARH